jgi:hypothetical protein
MPPGADFLPVWLPPWAWAVFYVCVAVGAAVVIVRSIAKGASKVSATDTERAVTAVSSVQPYSDRMTHDALIAAIGELHGTIIEFHGTVRVMADRMDRDRDERKIREDLQHEHDISDLKSLVKSMSKDQRRD